MPELQKTAPKQGVKKALLKPAGKAGMKRRMCGRGFPPGTLQQAVDHQLPRDPDRCAPGELAKHAMLEGIKAVTKYTSPK
ncbi:histone H2B-like [Rhinoraja longicauda]